MSEQTSKLGIEDVDFLVTSLIERCPTGMMVRELVQNAVEAAVQAEPGRQLVECVATQIDGVVKLSIWNTGPGLDRREIAVMSNMAAAVGKVLSLDENFGMGGKVASLASNRLGVRYRSCRHGRVHEVMLGQVGDGYSRIWRQVAGTQRFVEVAEVTDEAMAEGRPVDEDWTEVVLYGNVPGQDTVRDPYNGNPAMSAGWFAQALYARFFRLPRSVTVSLESPLHLQTDRRRFVPIYDRVETDFSRYEMISLPSGIVLHFLLDEPDPERPWENSSARGALQRAISSCAIVHRNEIYAGLDGQSWAYNGAAFGITFRARHISVFIELPDDYPVLPDGYREFLRYRDGEKARVLATDFARLVRENRPDWLVEAIRKAAPSSAMFDQVETELHKLWSSLVPVGQQLVLEFVPLRDEADIRYRWLLGRGGRFESATNQLLINLTYPTVDDLQRRLQGQPQIARRDDAAAFAKSLAELALVRRVGRALVHGLAKRYNPELWEENHVERAIAPEALSIAADDVDEMAAWAMRALASGTIASPGPQHDTPEN
jgi:hypothetical protein